MLQIILRKFWWKLRDSVTHSYNHDANNVCAVFLDHPVKVQNDYSETT